MLFRSDVKTAITELGVGDALVSFLDEKGIPMPVERAFICPPQSRIGPASDLERIEVLKKSMVSGFYEKQIDRESAYEVLKSRVKEVTQTREPSNTGENAKPNSGFDWVDVISGRRATQSDSDAEAIAKTARRVLTSSIGMKVVRGILGSLFGRK